MTDPTRTTTRGETIRGYLTLGALIIVGIIALTVVANNGAFESPCYPGDPCDPVVQTHEAKEGREAYWADMSDERAREDRVRSSRGAAYPGQVDCNAFQSQREAQHFFEDNGGPRFDPYNLDGDRDGIACEWN